MSRYSDDDIYLDPVSGVLKNRFGIVDAAILEIAEADLAAARSRELVQNPLKGQFDLQHLQAIHLYLFGDLYEWAGELRTVDISKNDNLFAHHAYIATVAGSIFGQLALEKYLSGLEPDLFSERASYYFGEINALHPFREGNGRTQREFLSHLAHENGFYIAWEDVSPAEMLKASIESFKGDLSRLTAIISGHLRKLTI
jgi:cell filamentation protein, protein adenylyltransferase